MARGRALIDRVTVFVRRHRVVMHTTLSQYCSLSQPEVRTSSSTCQIRLEFTTSSCHDNAQGRRAARSTSRRPTRNRSWSHDWRVSGTRVERCSWAWKAGQAHEKRTSTPTLDPTSASNPRALCVLSVRNFGVQRNGGQTESPSHDSDEHALTPRVRDENDIVREMDITLKS